MIADEYPGAAGYSAAQSAKLLCVSKQRISQLVQSGRLRLVDPNRRPLQIRADDIERELEWREAREHLPTASSAWPPSKRNQIDIAATLLATGLVDVELFNSRKLRTGRYRDFRALLIEKRAEKFGRRHGHQT